MGPWRSLRVWCWPAGGPRGWERPRRHWNGTGRRCCTGRSASSPARPVGPVVVVRASGQELPDLPKGTLVVDDPRRGQGPGAGDRGRARRPRGAGRDRLRQLHRHAVPAPGLHPAGAPRPRRAGRAERTWRCRSRAATRSRWPPPTASASRRPPSAWSRRTGCAPRSCSSECAVARLDDAALKADPLIGALDPDLDSVLNVNTPDDYQEARARPAPEVTVQLFGALATGRRPAGARGPSAPPPWHAAADAVRPDVRPARHRGAERRPDHPRRRRLPLAAGDTVFFMSADAGG